MYSNTFLLLSYMRKQFQLSDSHPKGPEVQCILCREAHSKLNTREYRYCMYCTYIIVFNGKTHSLTLILHDYTIFNFYIRTYVTIYHVSLIYHLYVYICIYLSLSLKRFAPPPILIIGDQLTKGISPVYKWLFEWCITILRIDR